jgi:branched-chain amino acid transport system substrate-binding protein
LDEGARGVNLRAVAHTGDFSETHFADLVQFYCQRREQVAVRFHDPTGQEGVVYIGEGQLLAASLGELQGVDAVRVALELKHGTFRVERNIAAPERNIFAPWTQVLLEAAIYVDESALVHTPAGIRTTSTPAAAKPASTSSPRVTPTASAPAPVRSRATNAPSPPPPPRRTPLWPFIAGAAVVVVAVAGFFLFRGREQAPASMAAAPAAAQGAQALPDLTFGMSAALTGPAKELGRSMKTGVDVAFDAANEAGGVNGRKLRLIALDDGYEPSRTIEAMKELIEKRHVAGIIGNVGTPTAAVAAPYAVEHKVLFFGAFTGAPLLRKDPPDRYVFNYRASYAEETAAIVRWLGDTRRIKPNEIAVFAQQDAYGDAGFEGVARAMRKYGVDPATILRVGYKRNTTEVGEAVDQLSKHKEIRAVVMVAAYKPAARFIEKMRDRSPDMLFTNVSFVGSVALADELVGLGPKYSKGAIVTQVVPLPTSSASAVLHYQELIKKYAPTEKPDFVSLEGYLAANLLIEGIKRAGPNADTEKIIDALEHIQGLDLGTGAQLSFGMSEHQASHKVWGTVLDEKGNFSTFDLD